MSLLLDHGHPGAGLYPIGRVWDEARIVTQRLNAQTVTEAVLIQAAVASVISEEAGEQFKSLTTGLSEE